ncbi:sulfotransferase family protein [Acidihalobacter ferrooxydans]|uniref:Sulfotransferase family protein n=1 Tax=Acidihalobacter ferrooxydans TaxID=1765967 RepID=A0A1P8UKE7_9GAMM|nr:sulfotransferase family protein [Acidihalobacter ferrooxydans]APZ44232.1 hypothetical protein BW247_14985 [Acidihalobacter ferrooxydans]
MTLKIIGVGMGRTGTASLKVALESLGLGTCYHMSEVLKHPERTADWIDAAEGKPDWDKIFAGYTATVDNPGCNFWKELADFYPSAKIILTVRDPEEWFNSTNETIHSVEFAKFIKNSPFGTMVQKTIWDVMDNRMQDKGYMIDFFQNRTLEIKNTIAPERLLVYRVSEGWQPLCKFLGLSVPNIEFPRINSREETKQMLADLLGSSSGKMSEGAMEAAGRRLHSD